MVKGTDVSKHTHLLVECADVATAASRDKIGRSGPTYPTVEDHR